MTSPGILALADGTIFRARCFGALKDVHDAATGEVVFNTSMYGYQEILTDPSYAGQLMCFTYPHIGNVGCNDEDVESAKIFAEGVIVRSVCNEPSNFRSTKTLDSWLAKSGVMGLSGIDTREVVKHLRDCGAQSAALACRVKNPKDLVAVAKSFGSMEGKDYVKQVSVKKTYGWDSPGWSLEHGNRRRLS